MFNFTYDEWYLLIAFAVVVGTIHHLIAAAKERVRISVVRAVQNEILEKQYEKQRLAKQYALRTEVVRTRYMVDAWLLRHPCATLRHPKAKIVLHDHLCALRAFFEHEHCFKYTYPGGTMKQYDNPYWRAVWHIYHHGNVRALPSCPFDQ